LVRGEDDDGSVAFGAQDVGQHVALLLGARLDEALRDLGDRRALRRDRDADGILHQAHGELLDLFGHGGREQRRLAVGMGGAGELLDVVDEAHVEHAVGFVEHQPARLVELDVALADEIDEPAGRGDQDVDAVAQALHLHVARHAAEHLAGGDVHALGQEPDGLVDLHGEFARRRENQRMRGLGAALGAERGDAGEDRQREGRRLAGAGLGDAEHVAAGEIMRDRLGLDRLGRGQACGERALEEGAGDAEGLEAAVGFGGGLIGQVRLFRRATPALRPGGRNLPWHSSCLNDEAARPKRAVAGCAVVTACLMPAELPSPPDRPVSEETRDDEGEGQTQPGRFPTNRQCRPKRLSRHMGDNARQCKDNRRSDHRRGENRGRPAGRR
jgi:hypothetical protein